MEIWPCLAARDIAEDHPKLPWSVSRSDHQCRIEGDEATCSATTSGEIGHMPMILAPNPTPKDRQRLQRSGVT
jgi:hypothetical protein